MRNRCRADVAELPPFPSLLLHPASRAKPFFAPGIVTPGQEDVEDLDHADEAEAEEEAEEAADVADETGEKSTQITKKNQLVISVPDDCDLFPPDVVADVGVAQVNVQDDKVVLGVQGDLNSEFVSVLIFAKR